jgi:dihydroorotate dehydrogenase (NAD+) catalytic subunit
MIELAPRHKIGLPVDNPVLLAGGSIGYGEAVHRGMDLARVGGVVVGPISRQPQIGSEGPRLAESSGGFVLQTGLQNRGVKAVMKKFARLWPRLGCPVIAQIADNHPEDAAITARQLLGADGVSGLELLPARQISAGDLSQLVRAIRRENDLPLWVKLPLESVLTLAPVAAKLGVDGLVVGQPLQGAAVNRQNQMVRGALYGPLTFAPMLATLLDVAQLDLPLTLIACGGIHTPAQARQALAAGAIAFQLDSAIWVEPGTAERMKNEEK